MTTQLTAKLRVCASCEWIFKEPDTKNFTGCPKCGFASYGARWVYGCRCYRFAKTQEPWMNRRLDKYRMKLLAEIGK